MKTKIIVELLLSFICFSKITNAQTYYVDVKPDSCVCVTSTPTTSNNLSSYWDLDHDGTNDFIIYVESYMSDCMHGTEKTKLIPLGNNKIAGEDTWVFMLNEGDTINKQPSWLNTSSFFVYFNEFNGYSGYWDSLFPDTFKFAGIKFYSGTNLYYGWLKLNVVAECRLAKVLVMEYAYSEFPDFYISSVNDINKCNSLVIYPNPNNGIFKINSKSALSSIEIYNLTGKLLYSDYNLKRQTSFEINLPKLQKGIYFARIQDGKEIMTEKIIIE
jgi:hypothetical protein